MKNSATTLLGALLLSSSALSVEPVTAKEHPNLIGDWAGKSSTIIVDASSHSSASMANWDKPTLSQRNVIAKITKQKGNLFWGKVIGNGNTDGPLIGAIGVDGKTIVMVGPNAHVRATLVSPTKIEYCYLDSDMSTGDKAFKAGCSVLTKQ